MIYENAAATPQFPVIWFQPKMSGAVAIAFGCSLALLAACDDEQGSGGAGPGAQPLPALARPAPSAPSSAGAPKPAKPSAAICPASAVLIRGGEFKVGTGSQTAAPEESPRFSSRLADFCMDVTEVTVAAYRECVQAGSCVAADDKGRFCNTRLKERDDHPINCVDWHQAKAYCAFRKMRLPSEFEWEYAARGGSEYRMYSWGDEKPDGKTCWKNVGGTCKVRAFDAGAFGLYDMIGNVWEWTSSGFGTYPWPSEESGSRVYRGGSWSRRFPKWMSPRLRNRFREKELGSHLGFRCAATPAGTKCPYGSAADGSCVHGVESVECPQGQTWNGARCARAGAARCPEGRVEKPGFGCVLAVAAEGPAPEKATTPVARARSPEFDADCSKFQRGRPHAYRFTGGTHAARNAAGRGAGCKNRDVGVGWNSSCCP